MKRPRSLSLSLSLSNNQLDTRHAAMESPYDNRKRLNSSKISYTPLLKSSETINLGGILIGSHDIDAARKSKRVSQGANGSIYQLNIKKNQRNIKLCLKKARYKSITLSTMKSIMRLWDVLNSKDSENTDLSLHKDTIALPDRFNISNNPDNHHFFRLEDDPDYIYYITDWIDGDTLDEFIFKQLSRESIYNIKLKLKTLRKTLNDIINALNKHGFYHRDLKHNNILILNTWQPKLIDFDMLLHQDELNSANANNTRNSNSACKEQLNNCGNTVVKNAFNQAVKRQDSQNKL